MIFSERRPFGDILPVWIFLQVGRRIGGYFLHVIKVF